MPPRPKQTPTERRAATAHNPSCLRRSEPLPRDQQERFALALTQRKQGRAQRLRYLHQHALGLPVTLTGKALSQDGPAPLTTHVIREHTTRHAVQPRKRVAMQAIERPPSNQERVADHILDNRCRSTPADVRRDVGVVVLEQCLEPLPC